MFVCALALVPLVVGKLAPSSPAGLALVLLLLPGGLVLSWSTCGTAVGVTPHVLLVFQVSSDSRYLAAGGHDRSIHVWDVRSRQYVKAFSGHRGAVSVRPLLPAQPELQLAAVSLEPCCITLSPFHLVSSCPPPWLADRCVLFGAEPGLPGGHGPAVLGVV